MALIEENTSIEILTATPLYRDSKIHYNECELMYNLGFLTVTTWSIRVMWCWGRGMHPFLATDTSEL